MITAEQISGSPGLAQQFFAAWTKCCLMRNDELVAAWETAKSYSPIVLGGTGIVHSVATDLGLKAVTEYYSIDAVFVDGSSRPEYVAPATNCFHSIRVAFEHEFTFQSGLFREVCHLLVTRTDLRVLVTYPNNQRELDLELIKVAKLIAASGLAESDANVLLVIGWLNRSALRIDWLGYTYLNGEMSLIKA